MLNNKEYDLDMKLTKIFKDETEIKWTSLISYKEEFICKGAVIKIPNFNEYEDFTELMFFESSQSDCSLSLLIITGSKSGSIWVHLPIESYYESTRLVSSKWIINNFNKWISPNSDIKTVKLLYNLFSS